MLLFPRSLVIFMLGGLGLKAYKNDYSYLIITGPECVAESSDDEQNTCYLFGKAIGLRKKLGKLV